MLVAKTRQHTFGEGIATLHTVECTRGGEVVELMEFEEIGRHVVGRVCDRVLISRR